MRVITAPCTFKESLTASAASALLAEAARAHGFDVDECPLADGGEGTLDALTKPLRLRVDRYDVHPMLARDVGRAHTARFGVRDRRALIEAAEIVGLTLVPRRDRDPLRATTRGLGELLAHVIDDLACTDVVVALGGTGTVDGGAGLLGAMLPAMPSRSVSITALVDVDVPLAGARMFMRQKFAGAVDDAVLDAQVAKLLAMFPPETAALPGAGAAGGLGAALASLGAKLVSGAAYVMDALDVDARVAAADVVVTGEGRVDEQTLHGKLPAALASSCARYGKPLAIFCGSKDLAPHIEQRLANDRVTVVAITPPGQSLDDALANAADNLGRAARDFFARVQR
jgi:glycerate kinase